MYIVYCTIITMSKTNKYPPENDKEGNVEYKRHLLDMEQIRIDKLITQMDWRMRQTANGDAIYYIGLDDDGTIYGIPQETIDMSIKNLRSMAATIGAKIYSIKYIEEDEGLIAVVKIVRDVKDKNAGIRVALIGSSGSGKTTLISGLIYGNKDNGKGLTRQIIFKHDHETESGKTSSIQYKLFGFKDGQQVNFKTHVSIEQIVNKSDKVITLLDLPGCNKYMKTMIYGLLAHKPDLVLIVVDPTEDDENINHYKKMCEQIGVEYTIIYTMADKSSIRHDDGIDISNITMEGYNKLLQIILKTHPMEYISSPNLEFTINEVFDIPEVGTVISGINLGRTIKLGEKVYIGPNNNKFHPVIIESIHKKQVSNGSLRQMENGSLVLKFIDTDIKIQRGMMILDEKLIPNCRKKFMVELYNPCLWPKCVMYSGNIIESVATEKVQGLYQITIEKNSMVYVRHGELVIFRNGYNTIYGRIVLD